MKHSTSHLLHAYWEKIRGDRAAPERAEIEPGEIRHLLADSLILELDVPARSAVIRLAGTRVCALYGRELRGQPFGVLWGDRPGDAWRLTETVALDTLGGALSFRGAPPWLGLKPLVRAETTSLRILAPRNRSMRPPSAGAGEGMRRAMIPDAPVRRGHLMVHPGGRA